MFKRLGPPLLYSNPFARLARHRRMVEPVMQLLEDPLYMH
jgi:ectoine hydroxylase